MRAGSDRLSVAAPPRQPWPIAALHWLTVLALATGLGAIWWREAVDASSLRSLLLGLHRHMGLLVWAALLARLLARHVLGRVDATGPMPWPMRAAAGLTHLALYALLFALPLLGWALSNAHGQTVQVLGVLSLPHLVDADPDMADVWADRHEAAAWALCALVSLHILAALWHHFVRRDGALRAILPGRR
jgi:cytochrome b561